MAALKAVSEPLSTFASTLLEICAYAGTWCVSHNCFISGWFVECRVLTLDACLVKLKAVATAIPTYVPASNVYCGQKAFV